MSNMLHHYIQKRVVRIIKSASYPPPPPIFHSSNTLNVNKIYLNVSLFMYKMAIKVLPIKFSDMFVEKL